MVLQKQIGKIGTPFLTVLSLSGHNDPPSDVSGSCSKHLESQPVLKGELILHSDQGSQFTSNGFAEFCESVHVTQSMSKAGYPYDNAPMEGYFNTLKSEMIYLCEYDAEEALYQARIA